MLPRVNFDVTMGFYFFPRGGSAQVVRYLCRALGGTRWKPTLFAGSVGVLTEATNAHCFFGDVDCRSLDYSPAMSEWCSGGDAMAGPVPLAASFEDKPGVADRIIVDLDDAAFDRQVASWSQFLADGHDHRPDVVHLHHLTPMHEAVHMLWPDVPVITHLHGTEMKMLVSLEDGSIPARPGRFESAWAARMRRWAAQSDRVVVVSPHDEQLAPQLLPVDPERVRQILAGVDTEVFAPRTRTPAQRAAVWKRCLVDEPNGWLPGRNAGSIRYDVGDLSSFTESDGTPTPVVLFAGRFMRFKRLQLLIEAHQLMRSTTAHRSVLVIAGGFPGEWEGEHPYDTARRLRAEGVFFLGWKDHAQLSELLNCSDVFAAPAVEEPFGLVYLESMAAGVPPIATATGGPKSFINVDPHRPTGWLVPPDDVRATADALAAALSDPVERQARGRAAARFVREHYSWTSSAASFAGLYDEVTDNPTRPSWSDASTIGVA